MPTTTRETSTAKPRRRRRLREWQTVALEESPCCPPGFHEYGVHAPGTVSSRPQAPDAESA